MPVTACKKSGMKELTKVMAALTNVVIGIKVFTVGFLKRCSGSIGFSACGSHKKSAMIKTVDTKPRLRVGRDVHPYSTEAHEMVRIKVPIPPTSSTAPSVSMLVSRRVVGRRRYFWVIMRATSPNGRLMMKIHRQEKLSTMIPPMSGPSTPAIAKTLVNAPTYLPRSRGGTMSAITTNVMAIIPPLPIPTKARAATRTVMFGATEQKTSPSKNTLIEI